MTATATVVLLAAAGVIVLSSAALVPRPVRDIGAASTPTAPRSAPAGRHRALVDLLETTSREVRSGSSLRTALSDALDVQPDVLPGLLDRLASGASLDDALACTVAGHTDGAFAVHGLTLAAGTGGATADTLDRVVAVVREREVWRGERRAQAAQARLSARVLTVLPMIVAGWGAATSERVREAYVRSPVTAVLAVAGAVLNVAGWWWMRSLVRGGEQS